METGGQTNRGASNQQADGQKRSEAPKATSAEHQMRVDMKKLEPASSGNGSSQEKRNFKVSPLRWRILLGICIFGFCNAFSDETASILNVYVETMGLRLSDYIYMSQMFFFVTPVAGFAAATLTDRGGVKLAIYLALFLATVRSSARALLFATQTGGWRQLRWLYWATQNVFNSLTVAQYYTLPLRIAESWFPDTERSLAYNLIFGVPMLGTASAMLVYPRYVPDLKHASFLTYVNLVLVATSILFVSANVHRSKPREGAPSARNQTNEAKLGERDNETLWQRLRRVRDNKQYLLQVFVFSLVDPLYWTVQGISQDILTSAGMNGIFVGEYLALSSVVGAFMRIICSYLWKAKIERRARKAAEQRQQAATGQDKRMALARDPFCTAKCKWLLSVQCGFFLVFCYSLIIHELHSAQWLLRSQWWVLIATSIGYIAVRSWSAPYYNEQTAELVCGTISEPTSAACTMFADSFMLNVLNVLFVSLRRERSAGRKPSGAPRKEAIYKWSVLFEMVLAVGSALLYIVKFAPNKSLEQQQQQQFVRLDSG